MLEIGSREWFQTTHRTDYFLQLTHLELNNFNDMFVLFDQSTESKLSEARVVTQSAYDAYQVVFNNSEIKSSVLYRIDERDQMIDTLTGGNVQFLLNLYDFISDLELIPNLFDQLPSRRELRTHILQGTCLRNIGFWNQLSSDIQSTLLDRFLNNIQLFEQQGSPKDIKDHVQQFLSEAAHQNLLLTEFYRLNKTTLELKGQGSLYASNPGHSLPANVAWMLANIHQGRQLVICSDYIKQPP